MDVNTSLLLLASEQAAAVAATLSVPPAFLTVAPPTCAM